MQWSPEPILFSLKLKEKLYVLSSKDVFYVADQGRCAECLVPYNLLTISSRIPDFAINAVFYLLMCLGLLNNHSLSLEDQTYLFQIRDFLLTTAVALRVTGLNKLRMFLAYKSVLDLTAIIYSQ